MKGGIGEPNQLSLPQTRRGMQRGKRKKKGKMEHMYL
jgi:hypothetical protein